MLASFTSSSAFAAYTNHLGLFRLTFSDEIVQPESRITETRTRSTYRLSVLNFNYSTLKFLEQLDGQEATARTAGDELIDVTFRSMGPKPHALTVFRDGILYFGDIHFEDGQQPEMVITTFKGEKHFALKGPIVKYTPDFLKGYVEIEGWIRDDGRSIEVAKLKREKTNGSETVLVTGMFNSDVGLQTHRKQYYIEGPNNQRTWIKKRLSPTLDALIGTQVFAHGSYTDRGELKPEFIHEELSDDDLDCSGRLMNQILSTQKEFQKDWKSQK